MLEFSRWKILLVLAISLASIYFSLPSFFKDSDNNMIAKFLPSNSVKLGIDLQGGMHIALEVDFDQYLRQKVLNLKQEVRDILRDAKNDKISYIGGLPISNNSIEIQLKNEDDFNKAFNRITNRKDDVAIEKLPGNILNVQFNDQKITQMRQNVIAQSIEIIRRRVDETGTKEPIIQRQGKNRIILQMPGITNSSEIKKILNQTARLSFHLLDSNQPYAEGIVTIQPVGTMLLYQEPDNNFDDSVNNSIGYNVMKNPILTGENLVNAAAAFQDGQPVISIKFDNVGAKKFGLVTKQNIGKPFAIILDDKVLSAPVIREAIVSGSGIISGNFTSQSATDLALLLRAGALPTDLKIVEERTVGPSLGQDSIDSGIIAFIIGIIFVMAFMIITYGRFGIYSNIALIINIFILISVLSLIGATLTLPGIAGIVLTLGMAVDANVLIFERIREELKSGVKLLPAVESGFNNAFKTIIDSNITTLIAALILFNLGSGPIKGFAMTLSIGITASMFSAILLTRMLIVIWLKRTKPKTINI
ncbi:MAG: protein translocase subunit SecD [Pseudomonadota bacterium]